MKFLDRANKKEYTKGASANNNHYPRCFDDYQQWREWCRLADMSYVSKSNFCIDCTPEYKSLMLLAKRCEYPKAKFKITPGGELVGDNKLLPNKRKVFDYPTFYGSDSANLLSSSLAGRVDPPYSED